MSNVPGNVSSPSSGQALQTLFAREVSEAYLLLDYISGRTDRELTALDKTIRTAAKPDGMTYSEVIDAISDVRTKTKSAQPLVSADSAFLLLLKDKLNALASPAKGSTIAFTTLFSGSTAKDTDADRRQLAAEAFPSLIEPAASFRRQNRFVNWFTLFVAIVSALVLWQFTHGAKLAAQFEIARNAETEAATEIYEYIEKREKKNLPEIVTIDDMLTFCKIPEKTDFGTSPDQKSRKIPIDSELRKLCNNYVYKSALYCVSINDIGKYKDHWLFYIISRGLPVNDAKFGGENCREKLGAKGVEGVTGRQEDAQSVIGVLAMMINYILPMAFGFVGAAAALIRSIQDSVKTYTLSSRDQTLSIIRLMLGGIAGVCVGLFLSPASLNAPTAVGVFTLSASGLAFLAGYGADAFFRALDTLIARVFDPETKAAGG